MITFEQFIKMINRKNEMLVHRTKRPLGNTSKYENRDIDIDTIRIKEFKKVPDFGDSIFVCNTCGKERIYGQGEPDNKQPFLLCEGICKGHTLHKFYRMIRGRLERYVGVPNYS